LSSPSKKTAAPDLAAWLASFVREPSFLARYPYYAHVLASIVPVADPSVPAMGVSLHGVPGQGARYYLHVNVDAVMREPQYLRGLLLHEVHHVVLGHLAHPKFFAEGSTRELMLVAQETTANEHIVEALPTPVIWQHFERFGFRAGQSTIERYELLAKARAEGESISPKPGTRPVDRHDWDEQQGPTPGGVQGTREVIERARDEGKSDAERAKVDRPESVWVAGRTPDELLAMLSGTNDAAEVFVDWRDALRNFVAHARAPVPTWSRPSRRFPHRLGEVPGRAYRPRTVLRPTIIVAIDTSLSMSERELTEIARQLRPMSEVAQLVIAECDASVARTYPFRGALTSVKGRGGTDLRPVFAPAFLARHGADGVVYFTDGQGPHPEHPPKVPVLWMLTKPADFACPWGDRARLTRPGGSPRGARRA
jgi:predicted metal-dependent peptidase